MLVYRLSYTACGNGDRCKISKVFRAKNDKNAIEVAESSFNQFVQLGGATKNEKLERGRAKLVIKKDFGKFTPTEEIPL